MGLEIFQSSSHCRTYYWNGFQVHQPHCCRARNQQLCYWSKSRTCFHLTWVYFPLKNTPLLCSDNLSLAGRWRRINMNNGESSCLETKKVRMERNLFCKQTQDVWDSSTCCLHKSTCWHWTTGLPRDSLKTKTTKSWKIYGMHKTDCGWVGTEQLRKSVVFHLVRE